MRAFFRAALFVVCVIGLFGTQAQAQGYTGNYVGTYTASKLPGQNLNIGIYFFQPNQNTMIANYDTSSGVAGTCSGTVNGNIAIMTCRNSTPSCPGTYRDRYTFTATSVSWVYTGSDCLGAENGKGTANKV